MNINAWIYVETDFRLPSLVGDITTILNICASRYPAWFAASAKTVKKT